MAQTIIDLSGKKGLGKNFYGDMDTITPKPNLRNRVEEGEMAQGKYNPYLREGYLAPATTTTTAISTASSTTQMNTVIYDSVEDDVYWADNSNKIYRAESLTDLVLDSAVQVESGAVIEDLEIYERNSIRSLYYTYKKTNLIFESSMDFIGDWMNIGIRVSPLGTVKPILVDKFSDLVRGAPWYGKSLTLPSGSGLAVVLIIAAPAGASISGVLVGGVAPTLVATYFGDFSGQEWEFRIYRRSGLTAGNYTCTATIGGSNTGFMHGLAFKEAAVATIGATSSSRGVSSSPIVELSPAPNSSYLNFIFSDNSAHNITSMALVNSFNPTAQTADTGKGLTLSTDGTRMIVQGIPAGVTRLYKYDLSTAFDITTATYAADTLNINTVHPSTGVNISFPGSGLSLFTSGTSFSAPNTLYKWTGAPFYSLGGRTQTSSVVIPESASMVATGGFAFTNDGLNLYWAYSTIANQSFIGHYTLSTGFNLATLSSTAVATYRVENTPFPLSSLCLSADESVLYGYYVNDEVIKQFIFNPLFPRDISKITLTKSSAVLPQGNQFYVRDNGINLYIRSNTNDDVEKYSIGQESLGAISSSAELLAEQDVQISAYRQSLFLESDSKTLECGVVKLPFTFYNDEDFWLTQKQNVFIRTNSDYNFIRTADNGFAYIFAQNKVGKIDGGFTGGEQGFVTKNVLLFPERFTITDAVDYRSNLYIAVHQYPLSVKNTNSNLFNGKCGVFVWNRISTQLSGSDFIEIPGVREIKKIYASPDGVLKLITISDNGLAELRQFGYNDSGGVVFPVKNTLGVGAFPQVPDGLTIGGDKTFWIANDGNIYCEKENAITQLHEIKAPGTTTATLKDNIKGGAILYGSSLGTTINNSRTERQVLQYSYLDTTNFMESLSPFDFTTTANATQNILRGDVYTGVQYVPVTSIVRNVRIYNAPIVGTGTSVIATVKLYFNQSASAGMTKSITKNEALRGYVDFHINKPNIQAVQIEIEWATDAPLGDDTYLPSIAVITHDDTKTQSPDNG